MKKTFYFNIFYLLFVLFLTSTVYAQVDYTSRIVNPSFELTSEGVTNAALLRIIEPYGWKFNHQFAINTGTTPGLVYLGNNSQGINNDTHNRDGNWNYWFSGSSVLPEFVEFYQEIGTAGNYLPAGTYQITCRMTIITSKITTQRLFANNVVEYYGTSTDYGENITTGEDFSFAGHAIDTSNPGTLKDMGVTITLDGNTALKIGVRTSSVMSNGTGAIAANPTFGWFKVDHFRLVKLDGAAIDISLSGINVTNGVLTPDFDPEITKYVVRVPDGVETVAVTPVLADENATVTGGGILSLTDNESTTITVTDEYGLNTKNYQVYISSENCYVPIFTDRENLAPNPLMTALPDFYGGWGATSINTNPDFVYCGRTSAMISGSGGGSVDFNTVGSVLEQGSSYLISAMFYVQGSGKAQIGQDINGASVLTQTTTTNQWEEVKTIVNVTSLSGNANIWLNNWAVGVDGDNVYIDNFQMYKVSSDNNLTSLTANVGILYPAFDPAITEYYLIVNAGTSSVNINVVPNNASSLVSGAGLITVTNDKGNAEIVVTAENETKKTYTIIIATELPDSDASLSELSVDIGTIVPNFNSEVTEYTLQVPVETSKVNFTAKATSSKATVSGDGLVDLINNEATHYITVTAENGNQKTYTIKWSAVSPHRTTSNWKPYDGSEAPKVSGYMEVPFMAVTGSGSSDALKIAGSGSTATIYYSAEDAAVVGIAAKALSDDVQRVTGLLPVVSTNTPSSAEAILIGTIGQSPLIDGLIAAGKIDISKIAGKWEAYTAAVVNNPLNGVNKALIIVGSDRRGTAFGVFALSESMGVSPWYFWANVPVKKQDALYVSGSFTQPSPGVKYRGIFLNDEDWGLNPWASNTFEPELGNIGPKTYSTIFELLLRLHSNCIWPAMHEFPVETTPFYKAPGNKEIADKYAIVISTSHHEPMMTNSHEYDVSLMGPYNYWTNRETIYKFWENRVRETAAYENIYTIGMRGRDDSGMAAPAGTTNQQKAAYIQNVIIPDQRQMLKDHVHNNPLWVPQIFIPYKETLVQYQSGLTLPDDIMIIWPDDNHGYIRQLSTAEERARSGGSGVYYHLSYWGVPRSYLWFSTTPPGMTYSEMIKAWDFEANNYWIVNVGDLKPMEIGTDFFLRLARNPEAFRNFDQHVFFKEWITRTFGPEHAEEIAMILDKYYQLNIVKRPEHLDRSNSGFSMVQNGDESQKRLDEFANLVDAANSIYDILPEEQKSAFYELVLFQARASYQVNKRILLAERSRFWASQDRAATNALAAQARAAHSELLSELVFYNKVNAEGKWDYMYNPMDISLLPNWARETQNPFIEPAYGSFTPGSTPGIGVSIEGSTSVLINNSSLMLPRFNRHGNLQRFIDVFNTGRTPMSWTAIPSESWIIVSQESGSADARITVSIDWENAPFGCDVPGSIIIQSNNSRREVKVRAFNPANLNLSNLPDAVEDNFRVVIEAENYTSHNDANGVGWRMLHRATASKDGMTIQPVTAPSLNPTNLSSAPSITYQFYAFNTGPVKISTQCLPTHRITSAHPGLRFGVSLNGETPKIIDIHSNEYSATWNVNTLRAASIGVSSHIVTEPGLQTVTIYMVDAGVVLDKITIDFAGGQYEAEDLSVHATNTSAVTYSDPPASGGQGLHIRSEASGSYATLSIPGIEANDYMLQLGVKMWNNRGIFSMSVAEQSGGSFTKIGGSYDLYNSGELYTELGPIPVTFNTDGTKYLRFDVTGKNSASTNFWVLLDYIKLNPLNVVCDYDVNSISKRAISNVTVCPTVTSGIFVVTSKPSAEISVYNAVGLRVHHQVATEQYSEIVVNQAGIYIIKVSVDGAVVPFKVVKK